MELLCRHPPCTATLSVTATLYRHPLCNHHLLFVSHSQQQAVIRAEGQAQHLMVMFLEPRGHGRGGGVGMRGGGGYYYLLVY